MSSNFSNSNPKLGPTKFQKPESSTTRYPISKPFVGRKEILFFFLLFKCITPYLHSFNSPFFPLLQITLRYLPQNFRKLL
ncbi:hypothetical protein V6N13_078520 [Hibiscus sabdariffa]